MSDFENLHPRADIGTFSAKAQSKPDLPTITPRTSEIDSLNAAILAAHPTAASWQLCTAEYDNGFFFEAPVEVTLADGTMVEMDVDPLETDLGDLGWEQQPGEMPLEVNLAAFKAGERTPALETPEESGTEVAYEEIAASLRASDPQLKSVTLVTEQYENGFFWSNYGVGTQRDGSTVEVDLERWADHLTEASNYFGQGIGRNTVHTIEVAA